MGDIYFKKEGYGGKWYKSRKSIHEKTYLLQIQGKTT